MAEITQTINSREYAWQDVTVIVGGKVLTGVQSVSFTESQTKEALYGKGNLPISIQPGRIEYSGELQVTQSELETMCNAGDGSLLNLNVDIQVSFGNPPDAIKAFMLQGCQFTEEKRELSNSSTAMEISLPFLFVRKKVLS